MNEFVTTWFPVVTFLLSVVALGGALYVQTRISGAASDIYERMNADGKAVNDDLDGCGQRLTKLEAMMENLPQRAEMRGVNSSLTGHAERIVRLEASFENLPQRIDLQRMNDQLSNVSGDVKALTVELHAVRDTLKATQASMQRVNDYLLNDRHKS